MFWLRRTEEEAGGRRRTQRETAKIFINIQRVDVEAAAKAHMHILSSSATNRPSLKSIWWMVSHNQRDEHTAIPCFYRIQNSLLTNIYLFVLSSHLNPHLSVSTNLNHTVLYQLHLFFPVSTTHLLTRSSLHPFPLPVHFCCLSIAVVYLPYLCGAHLSISLPHFSISSRFAVSPSLSICLPRSPSSSHRHHSLSQLGWADNSTMFM